MLFLRRKHIKKNKIKTEEPVSKSDFTMEPPADYGPLQRNNVSFSFHISNYIGETVTLFVESGGMTGTGFTGILLYANEVYVKLLTSIAPAPFCPLGNPCIFNFSYFIRNPNPYVNSMRDMGAVVIIPVNKIVSFVHNII
ncbi:MAG TPA: hypothetical protein PK033_04165 [Acetivibrio sp.]|nr:hypothetical protein [Clostridium sp.]HOQ37027.1 hypothetical protein [Acetivibrio sp.]HPT90683.1 hypothetical protein [Acetivibrio sp.]HQA57052.1 hypothetical protein [Acetivibrio sp.]